MAKSGRPPLQDKTQEQSKKVLLSFTEQKYDELKRLQQLTNRSTMTSTITYFMDQGIHSFKSEFAQTM
jgi:hypothetical protein